MKNEKGLNGDSNSWDPPDSCPPWGGGAYKFPGFGSRLAEGKGEGRQRCYNMPLDTQMGRRISVMASDLIWIADPPAPEEESNEQTSFFSQMSSRFLLESSGGATDDNRYVEAPGKHPGSVASD